MEAVNLLPAYARPGNRWAAVGRDVPARRVLMLGGAGAGAVAILMGGLYAYERSQVSDKQKTLNDVAARLVAVEAQAAPIRTAQAKAQSELSAVTQISQSRIPWETFLGDVSRVMPDHVYLTALQATTPTPAAGLAAAAALTDVAPTTAPTVTPSTFTVSGLAVSHVQVAAMLDRLALVPWLSNVTLVSSIHTSGTSSSTGSSTGSGDQFTITGSFNTVGGGK